TGARSRTIVRRSAPGIPESAVRTEASISRTVSSLAVLGASVTVTPPDETSMSRTKPKETMSRAKPGYGTNRRRSRSSWGLGTLCAYQPPEWAAREANPACIRARKGRGCRIFSTRSGDFGAFPRDHRKEFSALLGWHRRCSWQDLDGLRYAAQHPPLQHQRQQRAAR